MFVSILTIVCLCIDLQGIICYNDYVKNYQVVNYQVLYGNVSRKDIDIEIKFTCFDNNFHLFLKEDKLFQEIPVSTYISGNFTQNNNSSRATFYEGNLKDNSPNSSVFGFMIDDLFTAKITVKNITYFIEPAEIVFDDAKSSPKAIVVYRDVDFHPFQWKIFPVYPKNFPQWEVLYHSPNISANTRVENSGIDISNRSEDLFCEVEIVADHTLYNFFKNDTDRLTAVLYFHSKFADYIFSRSDFNMDGISDHIRIAIGKISIYKSERDGNYPMFQASSLTDYASAFVSRRQSRRFCLSIAMLYRKYNDSNSGVVGVAFRAGTQYTDVGGICDEPLPDDSGSRSLFFNTGVINMQFHNGKPLPLAITMLAFTHEIGHAFGSDHDPIKHPICSPGKKVNYLMYPISSFGSKNAIKFSVCSLLDIWNILVKKGACLKYKNSTCGNGIREGSEECDCGSEKFCALMDPCCTQSDAKPPAKGCTIRSKKGFKSTCSSAAYFLAALIFVAIFIHMYYNMR